MKTNMKKTILLIVFILSFLNSTAAQWYNRACGISDINNCTLKEFECAWDKASLTARTGAAVIGLGTSCIAVSIIFLAVSESFCDGWECFPPAILGALGVTMGGIIDIIGIPIWIVGAIRKEGLRNAPNFMNLNLGSLNVSPSILVNQFNNTHCLGVSLSFNF